MRKIKNLMEIILKQEKKLNNNFNNKYNKN